MVSIKQSNFKSLSTTYVLSISVSISEANYLPRAVSHYSANIVSYENSVSITFFTTTLSAQRQSVSKSISETQISTIIAAISSTNYSTLFTTVSITNEATRVNTIYESL